MSNINLFIALRDAGLKWNPAIEDCFVVLGDRSTHFVIDYIAKDSCDGEITAVRCANGSWVDIFQVSCVWIPSFEQLEKEILDRGWNYELSRIQEKNESSCKIWRTTDMAARDQRNREKVGGSFQGNKSINAIIMALLWIL